MSYRCDYHAILLDTAAASVLMLPGDGGWLLPQWTTGHWIWWSDTAHINQHMRAEFGARITTLRCLCTEVAPDVTPEDAHERRLYVLENHDPAWTPPSGARWVHRSALAALPLALPEQRALLERWLAHGAAPPHAPWYKPGWLAGVEGWTRRELAAQGLALNGPLEQLRSGQRGCVLRGQTNKGAVYVKALPPFFAHEITLTQALAARYPANTVTLLAVDTQRRCMLMKDFGGAILDTVPDVARWEAVARRYAEMQLDHIGRVDELLALGCPERRLEGLAARIDPLLADTAAMTLPGRHGGLSAAEVQSVRGLAPRLKEMCAALLNYGLPATLEHGDFYGQNIAVTEGDYIIFDWTDSSMTHPFFIMLPWLTDFARALSGIDDARTRIRDAYLAPWTAYAPLAHLIDAFEFAQTLAPLHYALIQKAARDQMDPPWEMELGVPFCLRKLLEYAG